MKKTVYLSLIAFSMHLKITKICSKKTCKFSGLEQPLKNFNKNKTGKYGVRETCKECCKEFDKKYRTSHKKEKAEYNRRYNQDHKENMIKYFKKRYEENKVEILEKQKEYYQNNKDEKAKYQKQYQKEHKAQRNEREKNRRKTNIQHKIACNLRKRLSNLLKKDLKSGSAVADLMMSISDFKIYLEERWYPNPETGEMMAWENYGRYPGWHIDHIIPLSAFDLSDREQLLKACHFSNLRPMWAKQNISENDRGLSKNRKHF